MQTKRFLLTIAAGATLIGLTACNGEITRRSELENNARYWQRASVSEATYMEGPKAQQMLHRDISRCVVELKELERLGTIRTAIPAQTMINGGTPDPKSPEGALADWETPERDGSLLTEFSDYQDFETCMQAKGWERVEHLPYDVAKRSRRNYIETIMHEQYRTKSGERELPPMDDDGDFDDLN